MQPRADPGATRTLGATAGVSAAANLVRAATGFAAGIIVARSLGPDGRGQFAFVTTAVALGVLVTNLGVTNGLVEARAKRDRSIASLYGAAGCIGVGVGSAAAAVFLLAYLLLGDPLFTDIPRSAALWVTALVPVSLTLQHWTAVGYIDSRVREFNLASLAGSVFFLISVAAMAALAHLDLSSTVSLWGVSVLVPIVLVVRRRHLDFGLQARAAARDVLRFGSRVNVATLATVITWRLDVFLVQWLRGSEELGFYAVAVSVAEALLILGTAARVSLVPSQSRPEREGLQMLLARVSRLMAFGSLLIACSAVLLAKPLVLGLYGEEFRPAVAAVVWLVPGIGALVVQGPLADFLLTEGRIAGVTVAALTALVLNVALDVLFLPRFGFVVASMASTAAYLTSAVLLIAIFSRETGLTVREVLIPRRGDLAVLKETT